MKKRHSRKFICEAIAWWEKQLRMVNEEGPAAVDGSAAYVDALRDACQHSSFYNSDAGADELAECQPPVAEAEFETMYKNDPSMRRESDDGDSPYDVAMKMFKDGCAAVGFVNEPDSSLELYDFLTSHERPDFTVAEMLRFGHDEMLLVGFRQLGSYSVTSMWYKPMYKTDIVQAMSEAAARRQVEDKYERYEKSQSESDELFEGVCEVKPVK